MFLFLHGWKKSSQRLGVKVSDRCLCASPRGWQKTTHNWQGQTQLSNKTGLCKSMWFLNTPSHRFLPSLSFSLFPFPSLSSPICSSSLELSSPILGEVGVLMEQKGERLWGYSCSVKLTFGLWPLTPTQLHEPVRAAVLGECHLFTVKCPAWPQFPMVLLAPHSCPSSFLVSLSGIFWSFRILGVFAGLLTPV